MRACPHPDGSVCRVARAITWIAAASCGIGPAPDARAEPATHTVIISAMQFTPPALVVRSGDTVVWVNKDAFPHNATAVGGSFKSDDLPTDGSWRLKTSGKGSFSYVCTLHPTMKASLTVK